MSKKQIVFADRLVNISVHAGLARIDFASFAGATQGQDGKPNIQLEITHQLVMPLEAFAQAVASQDKVLKELAAIEQRRREADTAPAPAA